MQLRSRRAGAAPRRASDAHVVQTQPSRTHSTGKTTAERVQWRRSLTLFDGRQALLDGDSPAAVAASQRHRRLWCSRAESGPGSRRAVCHLRTVRLDGRQRDAEDGRVHASIEFYYSCSARHNVPPEQRSGGWLLDNGRGLGDLYPVVCGLEPCPRVLSSPSAPACSDSQDTPALATRTTASRARAGIPPGRHRSRHCRHGLLVAACAQSHPCVAFEERMVESSITPAKQYTRE